MKHLALSVAFGIVLVSGTAFAATHGGGNPGTHAAAPSTGPRTQTQQLGPSRTGQPNQTCGSATAPETPGNAAAAPGSAFNPNGNAGSVYAGQQPQNSGNTASVAQYDSACAHQR